MTEYLKHAWSEKRCRFMLLLLMYVSSSSHSPLSVSYGWRRVELDYPFVWFEDLFSFQSECFISYHIISLSLVGHVKSVLVFSGAFVLLWWRGKKGPINFEIIVFPNILSIIKCQSSISFDNAMLIKAGWSNFCCLGEIGEEFWGRLWHEHGSVWGGSPNPSLPKLQCRK